MNVYVCLNICLRLKFIWKHIFGHLNRVLTGMLFGARNRAYFLLIDNHNCTKSQIVCIKYTHNSWFVGEKLTRGCTPLTIPYFSSLLFIWLFYIFTFMYMMHMTWCDSYTRHTKILFPKYPTHVEKVQNVFHCEKLLKCLKA